MNRGGREWAMSRTKGYLSLKKEVATNHSTETKNAEDYVDYMCLLTSSEPKTYQQNSRQGSNKIPHSKIM